MGLLYAARPLPPLPPPLKSEQSIFFRIDKTMAKKIGLQFFLNN